MNNVTAQSMRGVLPAARMRRLICRTLALRYPPKSRTLLDWSGKLVRYARLRRNEGR